MGASEGLGRDGTLKGEPITTLKPRFVAPESCAAEKGFVWPAVFGLGRLTVAC
jgi:hypothetical protein